MSGLVTASSTLDLDMQTNSSLFLDETEMMGEEAGPTMIHYSRPATVFAAVCAIIFSVVGILGE